MLLYTEFISPMFTRRSVSLVYLLLQVLLMTLQNAPPGLDYERDKRFSKVCVVYLKLSDIQHS